MTTLVIDLETGGINPQTDAICSISYKILGEQYKEVETHYIKPYGKNISEEALKVNGLTLEKLEKEGISLFEALDKLTSYLWIFSDKNKWNIKLMGHNLRFDLGFLEQAFSELTKEKLFNYCHYHYKDTMLIADFLRDKKIINPEKIKLTTLYEYFFGYDELLKKAHTSEADVLMTEKIYLEMLKK